MDRADLVVSSIETSGTMCIGGVTVVVANRGGVAAENVLVSAGIGTLASGQTRLTEALGPSETRRVYVEIYIRSWASTPSWAQADPDDEIVECAEGDAPATGPATLCIGI